MLNFLSRNFQLGLAALLILTPVLEPATARAEPAAAPYAWYAAEDGAQGNDPSVPVGDGEAISVWLDRSGNQRHLDAGDPALDEQPHLASRPGEGSTLLFDGGDFLASRPDFGVIPGEKTYAFAGRLRAADGAHVLAGRGPGWNGIGTGFFIPPISGIVAWILDPKLDFGGFFSTIGPLPDLDVLQVHVAILSDTASRHYLNGILVGEGPPAASPLEGLVVGADRDLVLRLHGEIAELLVYDRALDDAERQLLEAHLMGRHPVEEPRPIPGFVDVFDKGTEGYAHFRIPSIVTTLEGTLLAFAEARSNIFEDQAQNDLVMRRSTDGGQTWGELVLLDEVGDDSINDPLSVVVRQGEHAGRVIVMYRQIRAAPGPGGETDSPNFLLYSEDDGLSWVGPIDVSTQIRPAGFSSTVTGPGVGFQKRHEPHAGRLIMPLRRGGNGIYAGFSDDGGDTWAFGDVADDSQTPGSGNEVQMVEQADGGILVNARSVGGTKHRKRGESLDGGLTFGPLSDELQLIEPMVMASVYRLSDPIDGLAHSRILYAGPSATNFRSSGRVQLSRDEGETWLPGPALFPSKYGYSVLTALPDGSFGVLFERGTLEGVSVEVHHLSFARLSLDWLTDGEDCYAAADAPGICLPCNDGIDNDGDGLVDYPEDPACSAYFGDSEGDRPLTGQRLVVTDEADGSRLQLRVTSRDPGILGPVEPVEPVADEAGDPRPGGARLVLSNPASGETKTYALPGSGWSQLGSAKTGPVYVYKDRSGEFGDCRRVLLAPGSLLHAKCSGRAEDFGLDAPEGQGALAVSLELPPLAPQCMLFGGLIQEDSPIQGDEPGVFRAKHAPAPGACDVTER